MKEGSMEVPQDFLVRYVERRKRDLELCKHSLASHNFVELERVGHQLKGNGVTFGFTELSSIGKKMEGAAISKDIDEMENALKDFSSWIHLHLN